VLNRVIQKYSVKNHLYRIDLLHSAAKKTLTGSYLIIKNLKVVVYGQNDGYVLLSSLTTVVRQTGWQTKTSRGMYLFQVPMNVC